MDWWNAVRRRRRFESDLDAELRDHLARQVAASVAAGMSERDARRRARAEFGGLDQVKEECRDVRVTRLFADLVQDARYAFRALRKSPGFSTVAVVCLALGIGANTAIFTLLDAALLRSLPVAEPERLVAVEGRNRSAGGMSGNFSYPQFIHLREHVTGAVGILAYASIDINFSAGHLTDTPAALLVSDNYFSLLGVQPAIGRAFTGSDETAVVISHRFWRARFNGDPGVAGRAVLLNGLPFTVVGVAPPRFFGAEVGRSPDLFVPLALCDRLVPGAPRLPRHNNFWLAVMARLRPDIDAAHVTAEMNVVFRQYVEEKKAAFSGGLLTYLSQRHVALTPGAKGLNSVGRQFRTPLLILMTVVGLVLLIACANVANLLLMRSVARSREIAVRLAIGARRGRLMRQFLTESLVLSAAGTAVGLLFAVWSARALTTLLTNRVLDVTLDSRVLAFAVVVSIVSAVTFGVVPAFRATRTDLTPAFKTDSSFDGPGGRLRAGRLLVSGQVAICLLLLIAAGLFIQTLANLRGMDMGFRGERVLLATVNPSLNRYSADRSNAFYSELVARVSALPGVQTVSLADGALLSWAHVDGVGLQGVAQQIEASLRVVGPRFFDSMNIAIRLGRDFSPDDRGASPKVAIINETIARSYFGAQNPVGKHLSHGTERAIEIVGVVADAKYRTVRGPIPNTVYLHIAQRPTDGERTLHVRTQGDPRAIAAAVREQVGALDKDLPVEIQLFTNLVDENLSQERLIASLSGVFGLVALLLTAIGLYGVIAYSVQRRTREIGIRMSLGAAVATVRWMVLRDCLILVAAGVAAGITASLWLARFVTQQLYGVTPIDPATIAGATGFLVAVAGLAAYLPARRASRIDPVVALRE